MNEESQLKRIILQVLSLVGMVMFWNPKVAALVALLQAVVSDYWDQFYELLKQSRLKSHRRTLLKAAGEQEVISILKTAKSAKAPKAAPAREAA